MTKDPVTLPATATALDAAMVMRNDDIGDVIVMEDDHVMGIVTDRDIVVRALAEGRSPATTRLADIASRDLVTLSPDASVDEAVDMMRKKAIRRLVVCDDKGKALGVVSIGDLAQARDRDSALADISSAPPNQ